MPLSGLLTPSRPTHAATDVLPDCGLPAGTAHLIATALEFEAEQVIDLDTLASDMGEPIPTRTFADQHVALSTTGREEVAEARDGDTVTVQNVPALAAPGILERSGLQVHTNLKKAQRAAARRRKAQAEERRTLHRIGGGTRDGELTKLISGLAGKDGEPPLMAAHEADELIGACGGLVRVAGARAGGRAQHTRVHHQRVRQGEARDVVRVRAQAGRGQRSTRRKVWVGGEFCLSTRACVRAIHSRLSCAMYAGAREAKRVVAQVRAAMREDRDVSRNIDALRG